MLFLRQETIQKEFEGLYAPIQKVPTDWDQRRILCDWLEELHQDDPESRISYKWKAYIKAGTLRQGQRYQIKELRSPSKSISQTDMSRTWDWWHERKGEGIGDDLEENLFELLFGEHYRENNYKEFKSQLEAEARMAIALETIRSKHGQQERTVSNTGS